MTAMLLPIIGASQLTRSTIKYAFAIASHSRNISLPLRCCKLSCRFLYDDPARACNSGVTMPALSQSSHQPGPSEDSIDVTTFNQLLCEYMKNLHSFSDQQLKAVILNVLSANNQFDSLCDLSKFLALVDKELSKRARSWPVEELLLFFDLFCHLPRIKFSDFEFHLAKYRQEKIVRYSKDTVIEFIRLMNERNLWHIYYTPKYNYEFYLSNHLSEMSLNDIAVFLNFMTKTKLLMNTPNLFETYCERMINELPNMTSSMFMNFCQFLHHRKSVFYYEEAVNSVVQRLYAYLTKTEHFDANGYIELASMYILDHSFFDEKFVSKFNFKFTKQLNDLPLNRIARGLEFLTYFNDCIENTSVYNRTVDHLRRNALEKAVYQLPRAFISIMFYLSRIGIYPEDLLCTLFSQKFLSTAYSDCLSGYPLRGNQVRGVQLLTIDSGIDIEFPEYAGNRLNVGVKNKILQYYCWKIPKLLREDMSDTNFEELFKHSKASTRFLFKIKSILLKIFSHAEFVHTCYLLPHLPRPNLLFALDQEGKPHPLPAFIREKMVVNRDILDHNLKWFTFGLLFCCRNQNGILLGEEVPKVRQLERLGYNVINLDQWANQKDEEIERILRRKIFSS